MQNLVQHFPKAEKIKLIQDNLNTHNASSFYENMNAEQAYQLKEKFEFHYTPLKGSWLNAVEIEFSAISISRLCLNKRIPTKELIEKEILACVKERENNNVTINWTFDITHARRKMNKHYLKINKENIMFKET